MNNKKDIWKYCQICGFSIQNIHYFTHTKEGNFHDKCLQKQIIIDKLNYIKCNYSEKGICNLKIANICKYGKDKPYCMIPFELFYISKIIIKEIKK